MEHQLKARPGSWIQPSAVRSIFICPHSLKSNSIGRGTGLCKHPYTGKALHVMSWRYQVGLCLCKHCQPADGLLWPRHSFAGTTHQLIVSACKGLLGAANQSLHLPHPEIIFDIGPSLRKTVSWAKLEPLPGLMRPMDQRLSTAD